jgi:hypothetical protein
MPFIEYDTVFGLYRIGNVVGGFEGKKAHGNVLRKHK